MQAQACRSALSAGSSPGLLTGSQRDSGAMIIPSSPTSKYNLQFTGLRVGTWSSIVKLDAHLEMIHAKPTVFSSVSGGTLRFMAAISILNGC